MTLAQATSVLDRLTCCDQRGIEHHRVGDLARDLVGFFDDAVDGRALGALRHRFDHFEHAIEPLDLTLGLLEMGPKALFQLGVGGLLDHDWQRLQDLMLGVIDVLQRVHEQLVEGVDIG
jgi:hypothetical protein